MKNIKQIGAAALVVALLGGLTACDSMTTRQRDTAVGAGVGGAAGAVIGGSALSTLGGAAVGGVIGNQVGK
ncbi:MULTISPECIES: glycine zipper 2TM domain-containing protein [Caballeronia]|jgi:osmotically inducible lipoprotein OsmB|uniref:17 kDa surface antigen n=1 Tax=Caballeronia telluris TaxID=326475 RepID=A0A158FB85_9BURK|nr:MULTISPECIES: glycine zipper 2TM domain-containing protein [Caballeronia]MDR5750105.1 glycine zipper 2TM domain-containing protein [Caballeronia sp. LZ024]MDR5842767.1 glycine zipper 2TM domain-containing protein [Caballeronia sp. LZ031]SAL16965.1 17 kDa surface antigen [Caballeronia telluris]